MRSYSYWIYNQGKTEKIIGFWILFCFGCGLFGFLFVANYFFLLLFNQ